MCMKDALLLALRTLTPLCRAGIIPSTFKYYADHLRHLLVYITALGLHTHSAAELHTAIVAYGVHLYDLNTKRGSL